MAPNEICRIDKNEGVGTISMNDEENVEELNHRMIEHDAGSSIQQGKVNLSPFSPSNGVVYAQCHIKKLSMFVQKTKREFPAAMILWMI